MNFQQLEYILALARHRHFGKAAEHSHVTQATLSAMVKKLEEELGIQLFDRSSQPILTTEEGRQVISKAEEILHLRDQLMHLRSTDDDALQGEINLGIIPTVANSLLPLILTDLLSDHQDIQLNIKEITTEEIKDQLKEREIDLGILATPLWDDQVHEEILYYESMLVYGIQDESKRYVLPEDLRSAEIWLLEEGHCFKNQTVTICDIKENSDRPKNLDFSGSSFETLINMSDSFGGYTLIPELYFNSLSKSRKSKTRRFENPVPVREISLVCHRPAVHSKTIRVLSDLIRKKVTPKLETSKMPPSALSIIGI